MIKVVSNNLMRKCDQYTIDNYKSSKDLMYEAGFSIYNSYQWYGKIAIICGIGNNAGDGYVLANLLQNDRFDVTIFLIENKFSEDGLYYFNKLSGNIKIINIKDVINNNLFLEYDILVDAIFGTGFKGVPTGIYNKVISLMNKSSKTIISIDINSGLNGDNGLAKICVKSNLTISIGYFKTGHFLNMAKDVIGKVINNNIGIKLISKPYLLIENDDIKEIFKPRLNYSNKSTYGYCTLIGGSNNYNGAIRLANMATSACRSGAGVVTLALPKTLSVNLYPYLLESTIYPLSEIDGHIKFEKEEFDCIIERSKVITIGMGLLNTNDTKEVIVYLLNNYKGKLVIDADGLNALSEIDMSLINKTKADVVLTPHLKEFSRLTKLSIEEINSNPIDNVKEFVNKYKVTLLLKGPTTIIANNEEVYLVSKGSPGMATAGSGDVLSGMLCALLGYSDKSTLLTVSAGAYLNGLAGELACEEINDISMIASDTINNIAKAINLIRK